VGISKEEEEKLLLEYLKRDPAPHIRNELYPIFRELGVEPEKIVPKVLIKMERKQGRADGKPIPSL